MGPRFRGVKRSNFEGEHRAKLQQSLSPEAVKHLASINDFYCRKHFLFFVLAVRIKVALMSWEEGVYDLTGPIGMQELSLFIKWKCQKLSGLRLVRTACKLVGPGANKQHGVPSFFNAYIDRKCNFISKFENIQCNIVFQASSGVFHQ